ncbi:hypothetical protein JW933_01020 [candidate division FCPU426 bacterium]|nr:hypothetical protein [candidate division FCPU426 bacterium]
MSKQDRRFPLPRKKPYVFFTMAVVWYLVVNSPLAWSASPTFTETYTETYTSTQTPVDTPTSTMTPTPTATPSETPTASMTSTPLEISGIETFWLDHFEGPDGAQPPAWGEEYNAEFYYSSRESYAVLSRTAVSSWGKVTSKMLTTDVRQFPMLHLSIDRLSPVCKWKLVIRKEGEGFFILQAETSMVREFWYDYSTPYLETYAGKLSPDGQEKFQVELTIIGDGGGQLQVDYVQICRLLGPTPIPTPKEISPYSLNMDYDKPANCPDVAIYKGVPIIAWSEQNDSASNPQIYVKAFTGVNPEDIPLASSWTLIGSDIGARVGDPNVAADDEYLYLAYAQYRLDETPLMTVKRYNGQVWEDVGPGWMGESTPDIACYGGAPYVVWTNWNGNVHLVKVARFDGEQWMQIGDALNTGTDACIEYTYPQIIFNRSTPYVTWYEQWETQDVFSEISSRVYISCFLDGRWQQQGSDVYQCRESKLAFTPREQAYVVWRQWEPLEWRIYVRRWSETELRWVQVQDEVSLTEQNDAFNPEVSVVDETPFVIWKQIHENSSQAHIKYFDGRQWQLLSGSEYVNINPERNVHNPHLVGAVSADNGQGHVYVAWCEEDDAGIAQVCVKHYHVPPVSTPTPFVSTVKTYAWPNPFLPMLGQKTVFSFAVSAGGHFTIRILNLRGRVVRRLNDTFEWDGRSEAGHMCEGGLYLYQIEAEGRRMSGTIVLLK